MSRDTRVYETLTIIKWQGEHILANRKVEIGEEHWPIWDRLVAIRSARLVSEEELLQEVEETLTELPEEPESEQKPEGKGNEKEKSARQPRRTKKSS